MMEYVRYMALVVVSLGMVLTIKVAAAQENASQKQRLKAFLAKFPEADENQDGELTLEEAKRFRARVGQQRPGRQRGQVPPTVSNVRYGTHDRQIFDLWLPTSAALTACDTRLPVFVYFHGGGFVAGDKSRFDPSPFLDAGFAVVSGNYRFVNGSTTLCPAPLRDGARIVQYLRAHSDEWNLDAESIAVSGSSAGAVITMWVGYHDDLADADSDDPVDRQSSRVHCIVPLNGPSNLDPKWITEKMGGPPHVHGSFPKMFGSTVKESDRPEVRRRILECSPIEHVSPDDPPSLLIYAGGLEGIPLPESVSSGVLIHHAYFGEVLKDRLDGVGVPNRFLPETDPRTDRSRIIISWLEQQFKR